ncbi:MAG: hypothetical protein KBS59_03460, partial [Clostridiales bacterium]|nr:hypothetical protein [Clostridiales bacterium]
FSAVSKHTTGSPDMSVCDMILYIADYTEPGRKYPECVSMREYVHAECEKINKNDDDACVKFLESVVVKISGDTVAHLKSTGRAIDERTYETYVSMLKKIQG